MDKQKLEEVRQLAMSMTSHPVAFGTIEHTEKAGELLGLLWQEVLRLQCDLKDARDREEKQTLEDAAQRQALASEAHTWWTAARDATVAERERCAQRVALHSQYPIQTDYDRGYDKARKDAAETLRNMSTYVLTYAPDRPSTPVGWSDTDWLKHLEEIRQNEAAYARARVGLMQCDLKDALEPQSPTTADGPAALELSWVPLNKRDLNWHAHATTQLRAMHAALSAAEKTPRDPLEIEELWDEANDLREKYDEYGPEVYELFARLLERSHGIGAEHG